MIKFKFFICRTILLALFCFLSLDLLGLLDKDLLAESQTNKTNAKQKKDLTEKKASTNKSSGASSASTFSAVGIAFVDMNRILTEGFYGKRNYNRFIAERETIEIRARNRRTKIDNLTKELEEFKSKLNQNQIDGRREEIEFLKDELKEYLAKNRKTLRAQKEVMLKYFLRTINTHVQVVARQEGLAIVFDKLPIYYGIPAVDVTDLVIKSINQ